MHQHRAWGRSLLSLCAMAVFVVLAFGSFFPVGNMEAEAAVSAP